MMMYFFLLFFYYYYLFLLLYYNERRTVQVPNRTGGWWCLLYSSHLFIYRDSLLNFNFYYDISILHIIIFVLCIYCCTR